MRLDGIHTVYPIAKYLYSTKVNQFENTTDLNYADSRLQLTYVIERSQDVSLELYRLDTSKLTFNENGEFLLDYAEEDSEDFLRGSSLGYLYGVTDNIVVPEGETAKDASQVNYDPISRDEWINILYEAIIDDDPTTRPAETMHDIYAFGFEGLKWINPDDQTVATANDTNELAEIELVVEPELSVESD